MAGEGQTDAAGSLGEGAGGGERRAEGSGNKPTEADLAGFSVQAHTLQEPLEFPGWGLGRGSCPEFQIREIQGILGLGDRQRYGLGTE